MSDIPRLWPFGEIIVCRLARFRADDEVVARAEVQAAQKRVRELERVLDKKALENEILREPVKLAHEKN